MITRVLAGLLSFLITNTTLAQTYVWQSSFGTAGTGNGQLNAPTSIAIDPTTHNILITDVPFRAYRTQVFDSTGTYVNQFGSLGGSAAIDWSLQHIVAPASTGVQISDFSGNSLARLTGLIYIPTDIEIDPISHDIIIAGYTLTIDTALTNGFQTFTSAGASLGQFEVFHVTGGGGMNAGPLGVATDPRNGNILISDEQRGRVLVFNSAGAPVSQFGSPGTGAGQFSNSVFGLAVDSVSGNIFVADAGNNRVQVFSQSVLGQFSTPPVYLSQFGMSGSGNGQFNNPSRVAIDPVSHNILVVDSGNNRIQIFAPVTQVPMSVIEYYNAHDDLYFITANPSEAAVIDSGADNIGPSIWTRTGYTFKAYFSPGPGNDVCRFYNPNIPPVGSHFYTALPTECSLVRAALPAWNYELGNALNVVLPVNGTCPMGFIPVYRYYDNRAAESWRFITDPSVNSAMIAKGWIYEGTQMCSPS